MSGYAFHPAAYADLDDIWEFIAAESLDAADRVREEIYEAVRGLIPFPIRATGGPISPPGHCGSKQCGIT